MSADEVERDRAESDTTEVAALLSAPGHVERGQDVRRLCVAAADQTAHPRRTRLSRAGRAAILLLLSMIVASGVVFIPRRRPGEPAAVTVVGDEGQHFPHHPGCPYVLRTPEERLRNLDPSVPGTVINVENIRFGRLGNHFLALHVNLNLGYCCKAKLVSLPPKDDTLAPGVFNEGTPGPRWFDFTSAPDVQGFNASSCPAVIEWGGSESFHATASVDEPDHRYYTPNLRACIEALPRLTACEAAYFFPMDIDVCRLDRIEEEDDGTLKALGNQDPSERVELEDEGNEERDEKKGETAGNLVIHVRSGDIFVYPHKRYGQPPLQYYLRAIEHQAWDRVDLVTNGHSDERNAINPVVPALEAMFADGKLPENMHFHKNRTVEEDFLSMICVDGGLVTGSSTMASALAHHTTASRVYFFGSCEAAMNKVADELRPSGTSISNNLPGVKIYSAIVSDDEVYSPAVYWNNTAEQRNEMLTFSVTGFERCIGSSNSSEMEGSSRFLEEA